MSATEAQSRSRALTFALNGDFRGRVLLTRLIRQAVSGLLADAGCDREGQSAGMIVAQELAENLVKYSRSAVTSFAATVHRPALQHAELRFDTENDATPEEIARVQTVLSDVGNSDPHALYHERIASSSTRSRSELGLLRIVAESAMTLGLRVEGERVHLSVQSGPLTLSLNTSSDLKSLASQRRGESLRK